MKRDLTVLLTLSLTLGVTACGQKTEHQRPIPESALAVPTAPAPAANADMGGMGMTVGAKMGKGTGTVTAVNAQAGSVTLDHSAMPDIGWPAMKMGFSAAPPLLKGVKVGDRIEFDVTVQNGKSEVTAIRAGNE